MVTAAAHRCGKQLVRELALDGYDVAVCSLAVLPSRVKMVEQLGHKAIALRLFTTHAGSAAWAIGEVHRALGPIDALIHVDGDSIIPADGSPDATTTAALPDLVARKGLLMVLTERCSNRFMNEIPSITRINLECDGKVPSGEICNSAMQLLRDRVGGRYVLERGKAARRVA